MLSRPLGTSHRREQKGAMASEAREPCGIMGSSLGNTLVEADKLTAGTKPCEIDLITSDQIQIV